MIRGSESWLPHLDDLVIDHALISLHPSEIDGATTAEHTCLFRIGLTLVNRGNAQIKVQ